MVLGKHVTRDYEQAFRWWSKSAKSGNAKAIGNVGLCYQLGRGVEADSLQAVQYYTTSIRKGNKKLFENHVALADKGNVFSNVFVGESYIEAYRRTQSCQGYPVSEDCRRERQCRSLRVACPGIV
ncbi:MAG TPA: tetratricopeptide repeat protein [Muribaculaceae bacterium]|nr:tetratricopeptide repeat protein [Muribaculaceae bacterium]